MYDVFTFEWDNVKSQQNIKKHNVSFEEAMSVFYDELAKLSNDPDHSQIEDRFILIGHSQKKRLVFVSHVYKEKFEIIRIISAREATRREKKDFEN
ncbi:MAG: BrnT family toxin [Alphaproteobacteria bacterium]|nr:MAG: BrnT family toxin [Alphaproteobacteria bacterium]